MPASSVRDALPNGPEHPMGSTMVAPAANALIEARPAMSGDPFERSLHQAAEQVFLSPRVVDQRAFDEFAGQLGKLTKDAGKAGESLALTHGQVKALNEQLRGLMGDLTSKTDAALKALPVIEAKTARVQQLLAHVGNETAIAKARELRDGVAQELLSRREGLVAQLASELRESLVKKVMDDAQAQMRDRVEAMVSQLVNERLANLPVREDVRTSMVMPIAAAGPDTLAIDASLRETISDAKAAMQTFEHGVRTVEGRLEAARGASEQIALKAEQAEKSLDEALLRAAMRFEHIVNTSEQRTEAVVSEIAEQLLALRADAGQLVTESREAIAQDRLKMMQEKQLAVAAIAAAGAEAEQSLRSIPAMSEEAIQARIEISSREAANALSQLAVAHATHIEQARTEAIASIRSAATMTTNMTSRGENMDRITTSLAEADMRPLSLDLLEQLQAATQHASQTHAYVSAIITRLETLAARAEESRLLLGDRVLAAAHATDVIEQRMAEATNVPATHATATSMHAQNEPMPQSREVVGLLHQIQHTGNQLHQLGAWITHLLQAGEAMAQRLERAQRLTP